MYEWMVVSFFTLTGTPLMYTPFGNGVQACLSSPQNSYAIQAQDMPVPFGKDTEGRTILMRSGHHRLRIVKIDCVGKVEYKIVEPNEKKIQQD